MVKLIFTAITSLDGYIEDTEGQFDWAMPDDEVLGVINDLEAPIGTYLYGRRMYETMVYWETAQSQVDLDSGSQEFGQIWRAAEKIVYSTSLGTTSSARTHIKRVFDPTAIQEMKSCRERDITVAGPNLAAHAFRHDLVDECQLFLVPVAVGGGKPALPTQTRLNFELVEERSFRSGVVFLHYRNSRS
ncbi:MAG: dihydrofolate reductase family protein [Acidimicrobiales bacterium]